MIRFTVVGNGMAKLEEAAHILGNKRKPRVAYSRAINHEGKKAGTAAGRALSDQTGLPKSTGRRAVRRNVDRSTPETLTYTIHGSGGEVSLKYFKPRETKKGVSAAPWGARQIYPSTFMKAGWWPKRVEKPNWNRQTFSRKGDGHTYNAVKSNPFVISGQMKRIRTGTAFVKQKSGLFIPMEMVRGATAKAFRDGARGLEARVDHEVRRCCDHGPPNKVFVETTGDQNNRGPELSSGAVVETLATVPTASWQDALHEAGHGVIGHACGRHIESITAAAQPHVRWAPGHYDNLSLFRIAVSFSGQIGEMSDRRFYRTVSEEVEADFIDRALEGKVGRCDLCQMALAAWLTAGQEATRDKAIAAFRQGQSIAIEIATMSRYRAAIHRLARALMEEETIEGSRAHEIIAETIRFGDMVCEEEEIPNACKA